MAKRYKAYWGEGYSWKGTKTVNDNWFNISRGYEPWAIAKVKNLNIGQRTDLSDLSGTHTVLRLPDTGTKKGLNWQTRG